MYNAITVADTAIIIAPHDTIIKNGSAIICNGDSLLIRAGVVNNTNKIYSYQWNTDGGNIGKIYADSAIYASQVGTYYCVITDTISKCRSITNKINLITSKPYDNQQICIVTYDSSSGRNKIIWEKTNGLGIFSFKVYRYNTRSQWDLIGNVLFNNTSVFIDSTANPAIRSYSYNITVVDTCGNESDINNIEPHTTIHLAINKGVGGTNNLIWTPYYGFTFYTYKIYRDTSINHTNPVLFDSVPASVNSYTDIAPKNGIDNYYYIAVVRDTACVISEEKGDEPSTKMSISNIASVKTTGFNEKDLMIEQIKVYPNPFNSYTNIEFTLNKQSNVLIEVYNVVGEKINVITKGIQMSGSYKYKFSANELGYSEGIYYIKFFINGTSFTEKLVQLH